MNGQRRRLDRLAVRLTPQQAVRAWLSEAHAHGSFLTYGRAMAAMPESQLPQNRLPRQVGAAVRQSLRGQKQDYLDRMERRAVADTYFLYELAFALNTAVLERAEAIATKLLWVSQLLGELLRQDQQDSRLGWTRVQLAQQLPLPLDPDTAAAIQAAITHRVETWTSLKEAGDLDGWVIDSFAQEGRSLLPEDAWRVHADAETRAWLPPPPAEELRPAFTDEASFQAFLAGADFNNGLADVPDAEFAARLQGVEQAMRDLVQQGVVQAGRLLRLDAVPMLFLQAVPLLDGEWVDRSVFVLAEWAVLLERRGFVVEDSDDEHAFAWSRIRRGDGPTKRGTDGNEEGGLEAAWALRAEADQHLMTFPGRTQAIDGRVHLYLADYAGWKGRWCRGKLLAQVEEGFSTVRWNAWVRAHGGEGVAELAGVKVGLIPAYVADAPFAVHEPAEVLRRLAERQALLGQLRECTWRGQGTAAQEAIAHWRGIAIALVLDLYTLAGTEATLSRRYFGGQRLLYPEAAQQFADLTASAEHCVDVFNRLLASRHAAAATEDATGPIDHQQLRETNQRILATAVQGAVGLATVKALDAVGDRASACKQLQEMLSSDHGAAVEVESQGR
jgi:hypothetical protein